MAMEEKWSVDRLDSTNWMTWKFQVRHLLLAKGLWGYVDGSEVLAEDANEQTHAEFRKNSQRAFSTIALAISTQQLCLITSYENPKDAWDALRKHFERDTLANKLFLKKRYFRAEMKEGTSVEVHLKEMKEITDRLASIGAPISEEDQVVTLLGSLPQSYATLVTALEARADDNLKLAQVQQALINEEMKITGRLDDTGEQNPSAMITSQGNKSWKPRCYFCGQLGHFRRDCPKRIEQGPVKPPHKAKTVEETTEDNILVTEVPDSVGAFAVSVGSNSHQMGKWLIDSGASSHMTWERNILTRYQEFDKIQKVSVGDGRTLDALGIGEVHVNMQFKVSQPKRCVIYQVLFVPDLACNLFSVRAAASKGNDVKFGRTRCWIRDSKGNLCGTGSLIDKLYKLDCELAATEHNSIQHTALVSENTDLDLWHQRMGHLCEQQLKHMVNKGLATGIKFRKASGLSFCEGCVEGKMHRTPFQSVGVRSTRKLQLVHSDVCGPMPVESLGGQKYFVTFIDDYSRCCMVCFMKQKSEVTAKFKEFEAIVTNDCSHKIGALRTDNGGEYRSSEFQGYLKSRGIRHEPTVAYTPEQNGVAERLNRTLVEAARSMICHAGLSSNYWGEAIATATYVRNRTVTTATSETPYEKWYGKKPDVSNLKVFGCVAYVHVPDPLRQKLDKKAEKLRFVGYNTHPKGYRLLNEGTGKVVIKRDVAFNETVFGSIKGSSTCKEDVVELQLETTSDETSQPEVVRQRPERQIRRPIRYGIDEYADTVSCGLEEQIDHVANVCQILEPGTMKEALSSDYADDWKRAADSEYEALIKNHTWELVELPSGRNAIGCKWVFKVKYDCEGRVERFKGRLVAKGYAQKYGIDYDETFSPVVRFSSIRALLAYAVQNDMLIHQMDVITAFLNGKLEEEIYMEQPDGYIQPGQEHLVCKLQKSLYGLKQSPRCWNTAFRKYMELIQFNQGTADPCIYIRESGTVAIVVVYVDDLIIITSTAEEMQHIKKNLALKFEMKDMGKLHYCLGISIEHNEVEKYLLLHQKQYILNVLEKYSLSEAKIVSTPADLSVKLKKDDGVSKEVNSVTYQSIVGSLLYAAIATRPDIAQAVGVVAKFSAKPTEAHLTAAKRILRYLKGTLNIAIKYQKSDNGLIGYTDSDWAGDLDDRHSTTGNVFLMAGGPISWLSKKQAVVALSTSEAEYVALSSATQEVVWLRKLLIADLKVALQQPTVLMEDNQGTIAIARNPVAHARTKHIDIRYHYIREAVQNGIVNLC